MGGWLQAIGQADPASDVARTIGTISALDAQHQKSALTGLQIQQARNALDIQQKQIAADNKPVNLTAHPFYLSLPQDMQQKVLGFFQSMGAVNENGIGKTGDIKKGVQLIENTTQGMEQFIKPLIEKQRQELVGIQEQIAVLSAQGGKDKQVQQLQQTLQQKAAQYNQSSVIYDQQYKNLLAQQEYQRKLALKQTGPYSTSEAGVKAKDAAALERVRMQQKGATERAKITAGAKAPKVPIKVKTALSTIKALKAKSDSSTAALMGALVTSMSQGRSVDPSLLDQLSQKMPAAQKRVFDAALKTLADYYGVASTPAPTGGAQYDYIPGKGLVKR